MCVFAFFVGCDPVLVPVSERISCSGSVPPMCSTAVLSRFVPGAAVRFACVVLTAGSRAWSLLAFLAADRFLAGVGEEEGPVDDLRFADCLADDVNVVGDGKGVISFVGMGVSKISRSVSGRRARSVSLS